MTSFHMNQLNSIHNNQFSTKVKKTMNQQDNFETNYPTNQPAIQFGLSENSAGAESLTNLHLTFGDLEPRAEIKGGSLPGIYKVTDVTLKRGVVG